MSQGLFGLLTLLILVGCGKKGPPIPYDVTVPQPISDLEGIVREGKVFLRWSRPSKAPDRGEAAVLREFEILRGEESKDKWCETCPERLESFDMLRIDKRERFGLVGDRFVYEDRGVSYGHVYVYRILSVTDRGYRSDPSNRVVVFWDTPPDAPGGIEGRAQDRGAVLRWDPVEDADGYRVYRRQEDREFGDVPVAALGPEQLSHRDTGLSNEAVYSYTVRAVRKFGNTWVEGSGSEEVSLVPKDLRPPASPQALVAIPLATGIELSWARNTEPDLFGYFIYRKDQERGEYRRLNELPLEASIYIDRTTIPGQAYEYAVTAVDRSPQKNESPFSETVRLVYVR